MPGTHTQESLESLGTRAVRESQELTEGMEPMAQPVCLVLMDSAPDATMGAAQDATLGMDVQDHAVDQVAMDPRGRRVFQASSRVQVLDIQE